MHLPLHKLRSPRVRRHMQKSPLHKRDIFASVEAPIEQSDHTNKRCQEGRLQVGGAKTNRAKKVVLALQEAAHNHIITNDPVVEQLKTMSRSIQSRRNSRQSVRLAQVRSGRRRARRPVLTARGRGPSAARVIGLPLDVTFPKLKGIRWRYCTRWDEGPAAVLGMSLMRLGICRPNDWSGSAVDFVERGFRRFCSQNRAVDAKRVWVGDLRITDSLFELTEQERNQVEAGREGMTDHLYLVGDYEAAASIPIGATLARLEADHPLLPVAFYQVFTTNLYKWMRVYDYLDAQEHAEMWMEDLSDEELEASVYRKVDMEIPACIKRHSKTLKYRRARNFAAGNPTPHECGSRTDPAPA